jgi:hypothetical protein
VVQNLVIGALPNYTAAAVTAVTVVGGGAGPAGMPIANVKTDRPWEVGRIPTIFPHECGIEIDFGEAVSIETLALINPSWIPGDQFRVVGVTSGALPPVRSETLPPTAIEEDSGNLDPGNDVVENIQEHPSEHDADYITVAVASFDEDWFIRVSFGTPAAAPAVGTAEEPQAYQCFVLWAKRGAITTPDADIATAFAKCTATLYEGGVSRAVLGTKLLVATDDGQALIFPWDASVLQTADGSAVELRLDFLPGTDATFGVLYSLAWEVMHQADVAAADFNTGWQTVMGAEAEAAWGGTALQSVDLPPEIWREFIVPASLEKVRFEFRADGLGFFTSFISTPPRTPSGVVDVGMVMLGPLFEVPYNFAPGTSLRCRAVLVGDDEGLTGANRAVLGFRKRSADIELAFVPSATAHSLFARLDFASRGTAVFLIALEPQASGTIARNTTFLAEVTEARGVIYQEGFTDEGEGIRGMGYVFSEVL